MPLTYMYDAKSLRVTAYGFLLECTIIGCVGFFKARGGCIEPPMTVLSVERRATEYEIESFESINLPVKLMMIIARVAIVYVVHGYFHV